MLISSLEVDWIEEQAAPQIYLTYFMHDTIPRLRSQKKKFPSKNPLIKYRSKKQLILSYDGRRYQIFVVHTGRMKISYCKESL